MYDFDQVHDRMGSDSIKWEKQLKFGQMSGLTPFWIADTDFATLPEAVQAIHNRADHSLFGYSFAAEHTYKAVAAWYARRHGLKLPVSAYSAAHGIVTSMWFTLRAFTQPGDKVLVFSPVYDPFFAIIGNQGRKKVDCPLTYENHAYSINWTDLEQKLASGVKAMIFCNPHNPTGNVWSAEEVHRMVLLCKQYDVLLMSDEAHGDVILYGGQYTSAARFAEEYDRMIVYTAISKTFNMAGLESSCNIIPNPDLKAKQEACMREAWLMSPNCIATAAIDACYTYGDQYVDELNAYLSRSADYVMDYLEKNVPGIKAVKPQGTYLMWLDCSGLGKSATEVTAALVKNYGVAVGDGSVYGNAEHFIRFNIGCPRQTLEKGLEAMAKYVKSL